MSVFNLAAANIAAALPTQPQNTQELLNRIVDPFGVYCVLEVELGTAAEPASLFHVFPVMPESLTVVQRYLQTITPTQGGIFVDEYGRAPSPVVLQGTFGRSPRAGISLGQEAVLQNAQILAQNSRGLLAGIRTATPTTTVAAGVGFGAIPLSLPQPQTGYKLMKLLGELVDLSHHRRRDGTLPVVRFYNFAFGAHYEVTLDSFNAQMSIQRNGLWTYQLQMTVLHHLHNFQSTSFATSRPRNAQAAYDAWVNQFTINQTIPTPATASQRRGLLTLFNAVQRAERTINQTSGFATGVTSNDLVRFASVALDRQLKLPSGTVGDFINTVRRLPQTINAVRNIVYQTTRRLPNEVLQDLRTVRGYVAQIEPSVSAALRLERTPTPNVRDTVVSLASSLPTPLPRVDASVAELSEMVNIAQDALDAMTAILGIYGYETGAALSSSVVLDPAPTDAVTALSKTYVIRQGDTLSRIASQFYGDDNAWPRIVSANPSIFGQKQVNGLISELASTDVLSDYLGMAIVIPQADNTVVSLVENVWDDPRGVRAFGTDWPDELRTTTRADGTTDFLVLDPTTTLLQGLYHRIVTPQGAVLDDLTFGSRVPLMLGQTFGVLDEPMNAVKIQEALRRDARLTAVNRVDAVLDQDTMFISFEAVARNAGTLGPINLTVTRQSS